MSLHDDEVQIFDDDFERAAQFGRDNRGGGSGQRTKIDTAWAELVRNRTIGKGTNLDFRAVTSASTLQASPVDILEIRGDDEHATQFCLTLAAPQIYDNLVGTVDLQNLTGSQDSIGLVGTFPAGGGGVGGLVNNVRNDRAFGNPIAIVEWGAGGILNRCEADFYNGLCLNLVGSYCRVRAFVDGNGVSPGQADAFYKLAASLGPGTAKTLNAQRTVWMAQNTAINVESANSYTVPRFAKAVHLCGANDVHDVFVGTIRFYRTPNPADGAVVADYIFAGNTSGPIPIPNGAYYFTFVPGIANIRSMMAVFQLSV